MGAKYVIYRCGYGIEKYLSSAGIFDEWSTNIDKAYLWDTMSAPVNRDKGEYLREVRVKAILGEIV